MGDDTDENCFLTTELICLSGQSLESKMTPRFLAWDVIYGVGGANLPATVLMDLGGPKMMTTVLSITGGSYLTSRL